MGRKMNKFFRSLTASLLALGILLSVLPALAARQFLALPAGQDKGTVAGHGSLIPADGGISNEAAFSSYVHDAMYFNSVSADRANASGVLGSRLSSKEKMLYDALLKKIKKVAAGKLSSAHFRVPGFSPKYSLKSVDYDLGILDDKIYAMVTNVVYALLGDCPSELYWFDKAPPYGGWRWNYLADYDRTDCWITDFWIEFNVAKEYSASNTGGTTRTDPSKGAAVQKASANAKKIIAKYRGKRDAEKLKAYKDEICILNDYNYAAASDSSMPYGNPWQLVWVFDGDPKTNVVCEGYSKAFQYLCELSAFSGNVSVLSMTGRLYHGDTFLGGHMWNIVTMPDKKRYLVDVTNCDTGASGTAGSDELFLAGYTSTSSTPYGKKYNYGNLGFVFDRNVYKLFKKERQPGSDDYDPASDPVRASGTCGLKAEWSLDKKGVLKIGGSGAMDDFSGADPAPWKQYAGSVKKIVIGDSITSVGKNAFAGCKKAKSLTVGESVKKIGAGAFSGCKRLSAVTLKGKKLKTVGKNAFRGLPKKAVFTCPKKKLKAYRKLLQKKGGAPKTARFK